MPDPNPFTFGGVLQQGVQDIGRGFRDLTGMEHSPAQRVSQGHGDLGVLGSGTWGGMDGKTQAEMLIPLLMAGRNMAGVPDPQQQPAQQQQDQNWMQGLFGIPKDPAMR